VRRAFAEKLVARVLDAVGPGAQGGDPECRKCHRELSVPVPGTKTHRRCDCADRVDEAFDLIDDATYARLCGRAIQ
jgi:hypothetical protein